jgi:hypothetical protein
MHFGDRDRRRPPAGSSEACHRRDGPGDHDHQAARDDAEAIDGDISVNPAIIWLVAVQH